MLQRSALGLDTPGAVNLLSTMLPLPITRVRILETSISPPVLKTLSDGLLRGRDVQIKVPSFPCSSHGALFSDLLCHLLSLALLPSRAALRSLCPFATLTLPIAFKDPLGVFGC